MSKAYSYAVVLLVPMAATPGCNLADFSEPLGKHDFFDVTKFLQAYGGGCP